MSECFTLEFRAGSPTRRTGETHSRNTKGLQKEYFFSCGSVFFLAFCPAKKKKKPLLKHVVEKKLSVSGHRRPAVVTQPLRLQCYGPLSPHSKSQMTDPTSTKLRCGFAASHFSAPLRSSAIETHTVQPCWGSGRCGVAADGWSWRPESAGDSHFERCHLYNVRWRGVKGIISRAAAEVSRLVSYLLFTSPHYCTLAGAGGSVNIINMAVISPVPRCVQEVRVPGRKMKHRAHHQRRRCSSSYCNCGAPAFGRT